MSKRLQAWTRPLAAPPASPLHSLRQRVASSLRRASRVLARLARKLAMARTPTVTATLTWRPPELEFYAEAAAPEGPLYLDGEQVDPLRGVTRL